MSDNFWDTVDTESKVAEKTEVVPPVAGDSVFAQVDAAFSPEEQTPSPFADKYSASLSDFPVDKWDSRNDVEHIVSWFNDEQRQMVKETLDFHYFKRAAGVSSIHSEQDAQKILNLALDILNEKISIDKKIQLGGWMQDTDPQWTEEYEQSAGMWSNIAAAAGFAVVFVFFFITVTLVSVSLVHESARQDWPTGEAQVVEFDEWVETSCDENSCSDTQYAEAVIELHCIPPSSEISVSSEYVCGSYETADTVMFRHEYSSGFFERVPASYMIEHLSNDGTHTLAYNPLDPSEVDLQPGFQVNGEWFIPIFISLVILLVLVFNKNLHLREGYASIVGIMKGDVEV